MDKNDTDGVSTFYISQGEDECTSIKKVTHQDTNDLHSQMGLLPLITPYLSEIYEQQKEISKLKEEIRVLNPDLDTIVLSEDTNMDNIKTLMEANGCNLEKSEFVTFHGAGNITSAIALGKYIREQRPTTRIIIHRDRDYLVDEEVIRLETKVSKHGIHLYVPKGVDVESSYVCPYHINQLYPSLEIEDIEALIEKATNDSEDDSIGRLVEDSYKTKKFEKDGNWKRFKRLQALYHENKPRYRYGKKVAGVLSSLLQKELRKNPSIYQATEFLKTPELTKIFDAD